MLRHQLAIAAIDRLLSQDLGLDDLLLDTRNHLARRQEPGLCVEAYFRLRRQLSAWHQGELEQLRQGLESDIALQIIAADERKRRCLGLNSAHEMEDYCQQQMSRAANEFRNSPEITLRFCWT